MIPAFAVALLLLFGLVLSWQALDRGGVWPIIGGAGLLLFAWSLLFTCPLVVLAVAVEDPFTPPAGLHLDYVCIGFGALLLVSPVGRRPRRSPPSSQEPA